RYGVCTELRTMIALKKLITFSACSSTRAFIGSISVERERERGSVSAREERAQHHGLGTCEYPCKAPWCRSACRWPGSGVSSLPASSVAGPLAMGALQRAANEAFSSLLSGV